MSSACQHLGLTCNAMRRFTELDSVVLIHDLPDAGLRAGDLGAQRLAGTLGHLDPQFDPAAADLQLSVKSKVTARARGSLTMADPTEREVGLALSIPAQRWKKSFLYEDPLPIRRGGSSRCTLPANNSGRGLPAPNGDNCSTCRTISSVN